MYFIVAMFCFYLPVRIWFFINIRDYRDALRGQLNPDQAELAASVANSQNAQPSGQEVYYGDVAVGTPVIQPGSQPLSPEEMGASVNGMQ